MHRIREKDLPRLAALLKIGQDDLVRLISMGVIDHTPCLALLIKYSVRRLKLKKYYKSWQIRKAVAEEFGVKENYVTAVTHRHNKPQQYCCKECGIVSTYTTLKKNNGLCPRCAEKHIMAELQESFNQES